MDPSMYNAAKNGNMEDGDFSVAEHLRREEENGYQVTPNGNTILHVATLFDQRDFVGEVLKITPGLLSYKNKKNETALHIAANTGQGEVVSELLSIRGEEAVLVRMTDDIGDTALHKAVRGGHLGIVKILVKLLVHPELDFPANKAGETPLYLAAESGFHNTLIEILNVCKEPTCVAGPSKRTPLHAAVIQEHKECARSLWQWNKHLCEEADEWGWNSLHYAVKQGLKNLVSDMLEWKKSLAYLPAGSENDWTTAFHIAASEGDILMIHELLKHCPDCWDMVNSKGQNALHVAILNNHEELVNVLLQLTSCNNLVDEADNEGNTPLHLLAACWNHVPQLILDHPRAKKNAFNKQNQTPLDIAFSRTWTLKKAPMMMPTSGYSTSHGYAYLPPEAQRPTSSVSHTVTHTPTDSHPSSTSTSQLGMSSLRLRGNSSEPDTPTTGQSAIHDQVPTQVGMRDIHNRLVIELDGYTFNPDDAVRIISEIIKNLYRGVYPTWGKMPANLKRQIFLKKKCAWRPEHEAQICANFHKKAGHLLASLFLKARKNKKKPRWILSEDWEKLLGHWAGDPRFKEMSDIGKKARASIKGGSLHTSGAQSQATVRRKLEKELGRPVTQAEAFKATHTRKKTNSEAPDVWVEPRAQQTYDRYLQALEDFRQTLPEGMPLSQEQAERIWLDIVGGPSRYGYAYGIPQRTFREYHSELEGLGSSLDNESRKANLAMEQKIVELSSQVEASRVRERRRDIEYAGLKAQLDALLASGGIPPCPGDVAFPPRPSQSRPTQPPVYGQQRDLIDESSSEEDDEDHVENTLPH